MAVTAQPESRKVTFRVITGQSESGSDIYTNRSVNKIDPAATADKVYAAFENFPSLMTGDVSKFLLTTVESLVSE